MSDTSIVGMSIRNSLLTNTYSPSAESESVTNANYNFENRNSIVAHAVCLLIIISSQTKLIAYDSMNPLGI